ncbi:MAG: Inner membrane protein YbhL [Gemmatimonadaceae bacterium]|nr:Inner membrane protein YbhL [Gemmatimonadaceae bacterium]
MGISARPIQGVLVQSGADRAALVRRTYTLIFVSILVTIGGVALGLGQPSIMQAVVEHRFITLLLTFAPLLAAMSFRDAFPANIGLVFLFTFIEGVAISPIIYVMGREQPGVIAQAGFLTAASFFGLTAYAWLSRRDFSAWGSFFFVGLIVLVITSLLNLFFQNQTASLWIAGATVLVFSGLLIYDTWRLKNVFGPNDYVIAAVTIYLDLLNMFMAILTLLGGRRR